MTTRPLTDAALSRALAELADGPGAGVLTEDVLASVASRRQIRSVWRWAPTGRRIAIVAIAALLAAALIGGLMAAGMRPADIVRWPTRPFVVVAQHWNGAIDPDSVISFLAFEPSSGASGALSSAPHDVMSPSWNPTGSRVVYVTAEAGMFNGLGGVAPRLHAGKLRIASGTWGDATDVQLQAPLIEYDYEQVLWAPGGDRFAMLQSSGSCNAGPDCIPEANIDVFDETGRYLTGVRVPDGNLGLAVWSPDGRKIGWFTGTCPGGTCFADTLHWRALDGSAAQVDIPLDHMTGFVWRDDGRLVGYASDPRNPQIERVVSMRADGLDLRTETTFAAPPRTNRALSPDGRRMAAIDPDWAHLWIEDVTGTGRVNVPIDRFASLGGWSPDGEWVLLGKANDETVSLITLSVVRRDGTGSRTLGEVDGWYTWAPGSIAGGN